MRPLRRFFFFAFAALPACTLIIDTSDLSGGPLPKDPGPEAAASVDARGSDDGGVNHDDSGSGSRGDADTGAVDPFVLPTCDRGRVSILESGAELHVEDRIVACNEKFHIVYQADGNIVEYNQQGDPLWATNTYDSPVEKGVMQTDGEFVVYGPNAKRLFGTGTSGNPGAFMWLHDDGLLTINAGAKVVWKHVPGSD